MRRRNWNGRGVWGIAVAVLLLASWAGASERYARIDSLNALERTWQFSHIDYCIELYSGLAEESRELGYDRGEGLALLHLGVAYSLSGDHDLGVEVQLRAIKILERAMMFEDLAMAYGDLGYLMKRRDIPWGMELMRRGITIAEGHQFLHALTALYDNFGVLHEMSASLDSAAFYYRRALDLKTSLNDSIGIPFSLNKLSGVHAMQGEFAQADSLLDLSDLYRQDPADVYGRLMNRLFRADLHFMMEDYDTAGEIYRECLSMPITSAQNYQVVHCYTQLAAIYEHQQDFEQAYYSQSRFMAYRDSLVNVETNERIAALEIEFETEKKDRELAENALAIANHDRQVILLVIAVVLVAVVGGWVARYQQIKRKQLRREMDLRGKLRRAEYDQRMAGEKLRISRELHDNIGAQLTFLISSLDNMRHRVGADDLPERLEDIGEFGRTTLGELRQTVWAMKHEGEGLDALELKLNELKRRCASSGRVLELVIERRGGGVFPLSSVRMLNIYRIAQEAVQNAVKHAGDGSIRVALVTGERELLMTVTDEGRGFDASAVEHEGGLMNMRERCEEQGGAFELVSGPGGTRITCRYEPE